MFLTKKMLTDTGLNLKEIPKEVQLTMRRKERFDRMLPTTELGFLLPFNSKLLEPISKHFNCAKLITSDISKMDGKLILNSVPLRFTHCESWVKANHMFFVFAVMPTQKMHQRRTLI